MKCVVCCIAIVLIVHQSCAQDNCDGYQECPTWSIPHTSPTNKTICECANSLPDVVQCGKQPNQTLLQRAYCMTYDCEQNATYVGRCPFNTQPPYIAWIKLPPGISDINDFVCGALNRTGLLCSQCKDGLGVATLSSGRKCSECWNSFQGWALYVFLILLPPTIFFFLVALIICIFCMMSW